MRVSEDDIPEKSESKNKSADESQSRDKSVRMQATKLEVIVRQRAALLRVKPELSRDQ